MLRNVYNIHMYRVLRTATHTHTFTVQCNARERWRQHLLLLARLCTLCSHLEHMFRTFFIIKKLLAADSGNDGHDNDAAATPIAQVSNPFSLPVSQRKKLQTD